jgi:hypothetical protein
MNIFSVRTPSLASNEDPLSSGSALTPQADDKPAASFAAVLGASSAESHAAPGKKRGSKGAPFASGAANGNANAAQFQRSTKKAPQAERAVQSENAELSGDLSAEIVKTEDPSVGSAENHSIDPNEKTEGQAVLQNIQLNSLLLHQVVGEVPRAEIQSTATTALSAPVGEDARVVSSKDNLPEGLSGVGRINHSSSPGAAQSRPIEFGTVAKPASGGASLIGRTSGSGGSAAAKLGVSSVPAPGSKNTSLLESGKNGQEAVNNLNNSQSETVGSSNDLNLDAQTVSRKTGFDNVKPALTQVDGQIAASQTSSIGKRSPSSAIQRPDGSLIEQHNSLIEDQVPLAPAAGTANSVEMPDSPNDLDHEALLLKGEFEFLTEPGRASEIGAESKQTEMSRPMRTNGGPTLRAETNEAADVAVEVQEPEVTAIETSESLPEQVVVPEGKLHTLGGSEIPASAERSEFSRITTRPNQNFASPPPQSLPRNLTRSPAIKSATQLGITAKQNAELIGPNAAAEARIGQPGVSPIIVPRSSATLQNPGQSRTKPSSNVISSTGSILTAQEGSELGLEGEARGTTPVTGSPIAIDPKEKVAAISSRPGNRSLGSDSATQGNRHINRLVSSDQISQEKALRGSELEGGRSTQVGQPSAIPLWNSRPIRTSETEAKTFHENETVDSRQTPRELGNSAVESKSAMEARSEAHSLRVARREAQLNGTILAQIPANRTSEMKESSKTVLKPGLTLEQKQSDQSVVEARTEAKARSSAQAGVIFEAATEMATVQTHGPATAGILKSSDQLNRDLFQASEKMALSSETVESRNSAEGEFDSLGQDNEKTSEDFSGDANLPANQNEKSFPEIRRGVEPSEASSVLARARSRDLNSEDRQDLSPSSGGTLDAEHGSAMAFRANSETGNTTFGKNIPSVGKNDSLPGLNEQIVSRSEMRSASSELSSRSVMDASLMVNVSSGDAARASEHELSDFGDVARVGQSRLGGEVWSAVEKFRATSHQDWSVSIRPDQNTHLNLKMKMEDNQLHIQATLESGNWDVVAPHWPELQAAFADRGVQLKALEAGVGQNLFSPQFNQAGSSGQEHRQAAADHAYAREFFEMNHGLARGRAETKKPAASEAPSRPNRVLETWA